METALEVPLGNTLELALEEIIEHPSSAAPSTGRVTYAEYRALDVDDTFLYELLDGTLVKKSATSPMHQRTSRKLLFAFEAFISQQQLGELFYAPIDVFVDEANIPQPDLLFVAAERSSYELASFAVEQGTVRSGVLRGFTLDISTLFS
jgi:Uma2 family endonuclease